MIPTYIFWLSDLISSCFNGMPIFASYKMLNNLIECIIQIFRDNTFSIDFFLHFFQLHRFRPILNWIIGLILRFLVSEKVCVCVCVCVLWASWA